MKAATTILTIQKMVVAVVEWLVGLSNSLMRYLWKGSLSFGLVNVPVGIYPASREHEIKFTLLHKKDLSEIRYARICKEEEKEVPYDQIVKGYKHGGHFSVLSEEDFKKAEGEKSRTLEIISFCDYDEIDSIYFLRPYYLKADRGGEKAYYLLKQALKKTNKVAIVRFTFKNHNHIGVIKTDGDVLVLNELRFHSQILEPEKASSAKVKISPAEVRVAEQLIEELSGPFKPEKFKDRYVEDLKKAASKKRKVPVAKEKEQKEAKVYDIMALLKASLPAKKKARKA
jgi:DNA end-binding protein Ku